MANTKPIPLDKERIYELEEVIGNVLMGTNLVTDNRELFDNLKKQIELVRILSNLPKGTLLELI